MVFILGDEENMKESRDAQVYSILTSVLVFELTISVFLKNVIHRQVGWGHVTIHENLAYIHRGLKGQLNDLV